MPEDIVMQIIIVMQIMSRMFDRGTAGHRYWKGYGYIFQRGTDTNSKQEAVVKFYFITGEDDCHVYYCDREVTNYWKSLHADLVT